ncbi:DUF2064 domain-containing protein, partial [Polaromonas sp.]|uniref:TIGR04282 family arsenosugar biosynthesis glycosyltransferase n=1 Tax=Polaromonas sp. TaxID=1869339 RepID=UPI001D87BFF4
ARHDAMLLPVADGGYILIGLKTPCPELFSDMPWSTPAVAAETLRRMAALGLRVWRGPTLHDIDEPADLAHLPLEFQEKQAYNPMGTGASSSIFNSNQKL